MPSSADTFIFLLTAIVVYACNGVSKESVSDPDFISGILQKPDMSENTLAHRLAHNLLLFEQDEPELLGDGTWSRNKLGVGIELLRKHEKMNGDPRSISIITLDIEERGKDFNLAATYQLDGVEDAHRITISEFGEEFDALAAANAGFGHGGADYYNSGILKIDGDIIPYYDDEPEELYFVGSSALGIDVDNNWHFRERDGMSWDDDWPEVEHAIAGGHMLITDGKIKSNILDNEYESEREDRHMNTQHPRTAICKTADRVAAVVVVDGRHQEAIGMTLRELAEFLLDLGCKNAINFDGGGSSTMWTKKYGVVNHPSGNDEFDNEGQRALRSAFIIHTE